MIRLQVLICCAAFAACAPRHENQPYQTELPARDVMVHVISPAANAFWGAWGEISGEGGVRNLRPTTDEGWMAAENGAATVAEAANLLMLPSRRKDDGEWVRYAQLMSEVALAGLAAVEARDSDRMGATGSQLYEVCTACHEKYMGASVSAGAVLSEPRRSAPEAPAEMRESR